MTDRADYSRGAIAAYLRDDHQRLDGYLTAAPAADSAGQPPAVDTQAYEAFRAGLLRHIGLEEKILLPAIQRLDGAPWPHAARLRLDHAAIATLLVPTPTGAIVATLREILSTHNRLEEAPGGLYEIGDRLPPSEAAAMLQTLRATPTPKVMPHSDSATVMSTLHRVLERAGYRLRSGEESTSPSTS